MVKNRVTDLIKQENETIRKSNKSPTKPIDTYTNTRLFIKQIERNNNSNTITDIRRAHSTIPVEISYPLTKQNTTQDSEFADQSTTVGQTSCDSPTLKHKRPELINDYETLSEVVEFPQSSFNNDYRKTRILNKGCPKLLHMANKHHA